MKKIVSALAIAVLFSFSLSAQDVKSNTKEQKQICTHVCTQDCNQDCEHIKNHYNRHLNCDENCKATHDCAAFSREYKQNHKKHCNEQQHNHRRCSDQRNA
ncbi:hypothetical protein [Myroides sp. LoEW2-1]|uniref:hypothetical protein n=1 Tax=Myroides sp. LoEW2-1 TaxID=2683192 RepID=UPI0013253DCC|nr:hypothetical protein [Myroides sp. LoEW2-1]MVX36378.1 hypothetical protein [Myroides sp. LoEW2-1]